MATPQKPLLDYLPRRLRQGTLPGQLHIGGLLTIKIEMERQAGVLALRQWISQHPETAGCFLIQRELGDGFTVQPGKRACGPAENEAARDLLAMLGRITTAGNELALSRAMIMLNEFEWNPALADLLLGAVLDVETRMGSQPLFAMADAELLEDETPEAIDRVGRGRL